MNRMDRSNRRGGIAMLLVMGAVAFAFVVGLAVLSEVPATTKGSANLIDRHRLSDLAESGLAEGMYRMKFRQGPGLIWSGVTGRRVDDRGGTYDVKVTWLGQDDYRLESTGRTVDAQGIARSHGLYGVCRVTYENRQTVKMKESLYVGVSTTIPAGVQIDGNIVVNGTLNILGILNGVLSILLPPDPSNPATMQGYSPVDTLAYRRYEHNGAARDSAYYQWIGTGAAANAAYQTWLKQYDAQLRGVAYNASNPVPAKLSPITANNPLGVIVIEGNLSLTNDLEIDGGILVVKGNLNLNAKKLKISGGDGQLGLAVSGYLMTPGASQIEVKDAPAYITGNIRGDLLSLLSNIKFKAGLILQGGFENLYRGNVEIRNENAESGGRRFSFYTLNDPLDPLKILRPVTSVEMIKFGQVPRSGAEAEDAGVRQ